MFDLARKLYGLLDRRERIQGAILLMGMVLQACVELVGVASVVPFMSVVANPDIVQENDVLNWLYTTFEFETVPSFLTFLGISVIVVLALSNTVSAVSIWAMYRYMWNVHHRLCVRLFEGYLAQPYGFFVQQNTAKLNQNILSEALTASRGVIQPVLIVVSKGLVAIAIVGMLFFVDPLLSFLVTLVLGGAYVLIYMSVRALQGRMGVERVAANKERFKVTGEAFHGIKDVKVLQRERAFLRRFTPKSFRFSSTTAVNTTIAATPKYLLETVAFGGIVLMVVYFIQAGQGLDTILPTLSLYAFAGYRLMPSLQQLFAAASSIRFQSASLDSIIGDLREFSGAKISTESEEKLPFEHSIRLEDVTFRYPEADGLAIGGITFEIPKNTSVGLVGSSGSGKTTLVDLLLGLYDVRSGRILVDGVEVNSETIEMWRRQIGYVPQQIFLTDDTISANIAFGVPPRDVDHEQVRSAARIAHLDEFVGDLPDGYDTVVGERGVRLSGGQRQRIGIARALYHNPELLIMDEATSALDGATENAVMEAIEQLAGQKTIILIAHRLTTVQHCDQIYLLDGGEVEEHGTFDELVSSNASFRVMAGLEPANA